MGMERRYRDETFTREELTRSLAQIHRLDLAQVHAVLRRAEQAAAADPQLRPLQQWFAHFVEHAPPKRDELVPGRTTLVMQDDLDHDVEAHRRPPLPGQRTLDKAQDDAAEGQADVDDVLGRRFLGLFARPEVRVDEMVRAAHAAASRALGLSTRRRPQVAGSTSGPEAMWMGLPVRGAVPLAPSVSDPDEEQRCGAGARRSRDG